MIRDLFSHKIHSSGPEWPDKLVELAGIFAEFDGQPYDRDAIEERLKAISPRAAYSALSTRQDVSKFRDEISAYPAYLGLYRLEVEGGQWVLRLSNSTRQFLLAEEPDVAAFLRLQLTLFQYPNGMGIQYLRDGKSRFATNAMDRTLRMVADGVHLSPFRLIVALLDADSSMRGVLGMDAEVTFDEVLAVANYAPVYRIVAPDRELVTDALSRARRGTIVPPASYERRFHILQHTDLIDVSDGRIRLRQPASEADRRDTEAKLAAIRNVKRAFKGFDRATTRNDLLAAARTGSWGRYFDGVASLDADAIRVLGGDIIYGGVQPTAPQRAAARRALPLVRCQGATAAPPRTTRAQELADPELTRILRQRRSLDHKLMVGKMDALLSRLKAKPLENVYIDLYAEVPSDGAYLFEMKSGGVAPLHQVRMGVSQLYEYRYRHRNAVRNDATLCMVLGFEPTDPVWLVDYLSADRGICVCWFEGDKLRCPDACRPQLQPLLEAQN